MEVEEEEEVVEEEEEVEEEAVDNTATGKTNQIFCASLG